MPSRSSATSRPSTRSGAPGCPSPWPTPGPPSSSRTCATSTFGYLLLAVSSSLTVADHLRALRYRLDVAPRHHRSVSTMPRAAESLYLLSPHSSSSSEGRRLSNSCVPLCSMARCAAQLAEHFAAPVDGLVHRGVEGRVVLFAGSGPPHGGSERRVGVGDYADRDREVFDLRRLHGPPPFAARDELQLLSSGIRVPYILRFGGGRGPPAARCPRRHWFSPGSHARRSSRPRGMACRDC